MQLLPDRHHIEMGIHHEETELTMESNQQTSFAPRGGIFGEKQKSFAFDFFQITFFFPMKRRITNIAQSLQGRKDFSLCMHLERNLKQESFKHFLVEKDFISTRKLIVQGIVMILFLNSAYNALPLSMNEVRGQCPPPTLINFLRNCVGRTKNDENNRRR